MPKAKAKKPETTGKKSVSKSVERVLKDFDSAWEYTTGSWQDRWNNNYALYNNNRVKIGYEGITDTFVPMTFSTIETMTSALFGTKPKFAFLPPKEKPDQKTDILNALLDFYWDKDQWNIKVINWGRAFLMLGTSIVYVCWEGDHPRMINVPIRDFFIDPMATSLEDARYMGRRYLTTKKELESFEVVDLDAPADADGTQPMKKKYKNTGKLDGYKTLEKTDKEEKDMFYGSTVTNPDDHQVEVIEIWYMDTDEVVSVGNRCEVIEEAENYYLTKAKAEGAKNPQSIAPFAALRDYVDESLFYAKGEVDFILDEQELLNDITNQNIDSLTYTLNQMTRIDPSRADLFNEYENIPGGVWMAKAGEIEPIPIGNVPPEAFNERQNIKNEIRETTASNEIVKGVGQETKTTATEVNAQIAGAGQRMGLKVTQIENEGFHRLAKIVFEMIKLYVTEPQMVRIVGKDGAKWEEFDPKEFQGDYEPRVQLDITIENQKEEDAAKAKEMLAAFLGDPDINQQELKKMVLAKSFDLDPDEVGALVQVQSPLPGMGAPGGTPSPAEGMGSGVAPPIDQLPPEQPVPEPVVDDQGNVLNPITGEVIGYLDSMTGEIVPVEAEAVA